MDAQPQGNWVDRMRRNGNQALPLDNHHPILRSSIGWHRDGGEITWNQWLTFQPEIVPLVDALDLSHVSHNNGISVDEVKAKLWIPIQALGQNNAQERHQQIKYTSWVNLDVAIELYREHWMKLVARICAAAMTCEVETIPLNTNLSEPGAVLWQMMANKMSADAVEPIMEMFARGKRRLNFLEIYEEWLVTANDGIPRLWDVKLSQQAMAVFVFVKQQAELWEQQAQQHSQLNRLQTDMLIQSRDFYQQGGTLGHWNYQQGDEGDERSTFTTPDNVQESKGKLMTCALYEQARQNIPKYNHDDFTYNWSLIGATNAQLRTLGVSMFMLGQYSKEHYEWQKIGTDYWQVYTTIEGEAGYSISTLLRGQLMDRLHYFNLTLPLQRLRWCDEKTDMPEGIKILLGARQINSRHVLHQATKAIIPRNNAIRRVRREQDVNVPVPWMG